VFNLGIDMNTFIANASVPRYSQTWNLTDASYGTAWSTLTTAGATSGLSYNVIALDSTTGAARYLSTAGTNVTATWASLANSKLDAFNTMDLYVNANATRGTMGTGAGAATAIPTDVANSYFFKVNGSGTGATWVANTTQNTVAGVATAQNFWLLKDGPGNGAAPSVRTAFGYDINGNGSIGAGEYGQWTVNQAAGTITFTNPVPEPETFAMLLAGLGLMGAIVRRRKTAA
jgi:hypothetical protein